MAEAVLFDFGGTLDADGRTWSQRFHEEYRAVGGRLDFAKFADRFALADLLLGERPGIARMGFGRMVEVQIELLRRLIPDADGLDSIGWRGRFVKDSRRTAERNRLLLMGLTRRFELGVVSNFSGNLQSCLDELGLRDCFAVVVDSAVVGVRKPDPRLFQVAFTALRRQPGECWMVGDNPFSDIAPAAGLGCATCWLAPAERPLPAGVVPTRRISTLPELTAVLR